MDFNDKFLYLRTLGDGIRLSPEELMDNNKLINLSEVVIEKTDSFNTFKIIKSRYYEEGIYYHNIILQRYLDEKANLINENVDLQKKIALLEDEIKLYKTKIKKMSVLKFIFSKIFKKI